MLPLVSVIIPTYKRSDNLLRAIQSVRNQSYSNIEIIVVDDNGKGNEWQIITEKELSKLLAEKAITYIIHDFNKNASAARNTGFRASHGEYVNFLDDDDILLPTKIEKEVACLKDTDSSWGGCYCNVTVKRIQNFTHRVQVSHSNNNLEGNICKEYLLGKCGFNTSTLLLKRDAVMRLKGFDERFRRHQDVEFLIRFFDYYNILCAGPEHLMIYDLRSGGRPSYNDYETKFLLLTERKASLVRKGIYDEVAFWFWVQCARNAICAINVPIYIRSLTNARKLHGLSIKEYISHVKLVCVGILLRLTRI